MTKLTKGQVIVYSIEEIIKAFEDSNYEDCRINAYPAFLNEAEERDYQNGVNLDIFSPNILFIEIDLKDFNSKVELDKTINKILKHISKILYDIRPLLIWSGRGYHIIIPVKAPEALEHFEDFKDLTEKPSSEFLQFAKTHLSFDKADKANNPAFRSCLLKVPYTFNSKCFDEYTGPEVKIIQEFVSSKPLPGIDNLLVEFMTFLVDRKLKEEKRKIQNKNIQCLNNSTLSTIPYVEKLLTLSLTDYRKYAISLILAPYFVNIVHLSDEESFNRIKQWALKCNEVKPLKPSIRDFDYIIRNAVKRAKDTGVKPLKFRDTLRFRNKELYQLLL